MSPRASRPEHPHGVPKKWHGLLTPRQVRGYLATGKRPWPRLKEIAPDHETLAQGISIISCYGHDDKPEGVHFGLRGASRDGYARWLRRHRNCGKVPLDFRA